ncbi:MAG: hypothetical protein R2849_10615 [Thermomicrobiales bacterium]
MASIPKNCAGVATPSGSWLGESGFGGIAFMAMPFDAMKLHWVMMYAFLYAMAGVIASESDAR